MKRLISSRLVVILAAAVVLCGAAVPSSAAGARVERFASAFWMFPTSDPHQFVAYDAFAWTDEGTGGFDIAGVSRSICTKARRKNGTMIECRGGDFVSADPAKTFEMSPDGSSATLRIERRGHTHVVHWTSDPTGLGFYEAEEICLPSGGQGYGGGITRAASATGKIFGKKLGRSRFADIEIGVMVSQCGLPTFHHDRTGRVTGYSLLIPR
ncbi:MAG TPA: hypothetical protein VFK89_06435 [Actinomycetota bacterium]|nr:hypothetical protein [Actinomycetota bacterium]